MGFAYLSIASCILCNVVNVYPRFAKRGFVVPNIYEERTSTNGRYILKCLEFFPFSSIRSCRIVMLGLDFAGKTTILYRLESGKVLESTPTIGFHMETIRYKVMELAVWDVGGSKQIRSLWNHYLKGAHALIYVVDASDSCRLSESAKELEIILDDINMKSIPILVFANKCDQKVAHTVDELVVHLGLDNEQSRRWIVQLSNAHTGTGLAEGLEWLHQNL